MHIIHKTSVLAVLLASASLAPHAAYAQVQNAHSARQEVQTPQGEPKLQDTLYNNTDKKWADILSKYVQVQKNGPSRFDYAALQGSDDDMRELSFYIGELAGMTPSTLPRNEAMAYWANLYNALTVRVVAQNFPVSSIHEIKSGWRAGPWRRQLVTVEGKQLSLDDIEHGIMRPTFKTPLVHYMVNCASIGCPNLKATPWRAQTLEADQQAAARAYINSPRGVSIIDGRVNASSIYKWFKKDFGSSQADVLDHFRRYADDDLKAALANKTKISQFSYDWHVNMP